MNQDILRQIHKIKYLFDNFENEMINTLEMCLSRDLYQENEMINEEHKQYVEDFIPEQKKDFVPEGWVTIQQFIKKHPQFYANTDSMTSLIKKNQNRLKKFSKKMNVESRKKWIFDEQKMLNYLESR